MIYFVQLESGAIKIGFTENIEARLAQLGSHYQSPVFLLATMPGDRKQEREIHERFEHLRFGRLEQFRPANELMEFIGAPILVGANPLMIEFQSSRLEKYINVRIPLWAYLEAKKAAGIKGLDLSRYLGEMILANASKDLKSEARKIVAEDQPKR